MAPAVAAGELAVLSNKWGVRRCEAPYQTPDLLFVAGGAQGCRRHAVVRSRASHVRRRVRRGAAEHAGSAGPTHTTSSRTAATYTELSQRCPREAWGSTRFGEGRPWR